MSNWISFIGWTFIPEFIVNNLHAFYYSLTIRAGDPKPQPGTPTFFKHRRRIYILVTCLYLAYQLYEADWTINREGDFYKDLGVPYNADDRAINSRFRKLTLLHHPDKLPLTATPSHRTQISSLYIHLTTARDTLLSPSKRFAYDRLGPVITTSPALTQIKTTHDYALYALRSLLPFYGSALLASYIFTQFGLLDSRGTFWRFLALVALATLEAHALTRPWHTWITELPSLFNPWTRAFASSIPAPVAKYVLGLEAGWEVAYLRHPYLPFQAIRVLHTTLATFFLAMSRLGPLLFPLDPRTEGSEEKRLMSQVARLEMNTQKIVTESARQLALEGVPFRRGQGPRDLGLVRMVEKVRGWLVANAVQQDPEVKEAVQRVVEGRATEEM